MTLEISVSINLVTFHLLLGAAFHNILMSKQKAPLQKECLTRKSKKLKVKNGIPSFFFTFAFLFLSLPSFAGIIPSRFIGSILSFRPARPFAPLAYSDFQGKF